MKRRHHEAGSNQATDCVLMIRPVRFLSNPETASSNAFQHSGLDTGLAQSAALAEFDAYAAALRTAGVFVLVIDDTPQPHTPDAIFPNNWLSCDRSGRVFLYPMQAHNRRLERRLAILAELETHFLINEIVDLGAYASEDRFLEGTGSMVLDHEDAMAYVCRSPRSHPAVLDAFARRTGIAALWFSAVDRRGQPIYHTNVMMWIGSTLAMVCLEAIVCLRERLQVLQSLVNAGKRVIAISHAQMEQFAGNMLELRSGCGKPVLALSRRAWESLSSAQQDMIAANAAPVIAALDTIESAGGGGARCMLAEIFLPRRDYTS